MLIEKQNNRVTIKQIIDRYSDKIFDIYGFNCEMYEDCDGNMFTIDPDGNKPKYGEDGFSVVHTLFSHMFGKWEIGITTTHKSIVVCYPSGAIKTTHHFNIPAKTEYKVLLTPCHIILTLVEDSLVKENVIIPVRDASIIRGGVRSTFFVPSVTGVTLVEARLIKEDGKDKAVINASYRDYMMFSQIWYFPGLMTENKEFMVSAHESLLISNNTKGEHNVVSDQWTHVLNDLDDFEVFLTVFITNYVYSVYNRKILLGDIHNTIDKLRAGPVVARVFTNTSEEIAFATKSLKSFDKLHRVAGFNITNNTVSDFPLERQNGFKIDKSDVVFGPGPDNSDYSSTGQVKILPMMETSSTDPGVLNPLTNEVTVEQENKHTTKMSVLQGLIEKIKKYNKP